MYVNEVTLRSTGASLISVKFDISMHLAIQKLLD